jgi:hypothetical protein
MGEIVLELPDDIGETENTLHGTGVLFQFVKVVDRPDFDPTKPGTYLEPQTVHDDAVEQMMEATAGTTWV